jgi:V8-like Glu-specific endopeptidase
VTSPTPILDRHPYPWADPAAWQLHTELTRAFPSAAVALRLAAGAELDPYAIHADQAPSLVWQEILQAAAAAGLTRALVQRARDQLNASAPLRGFLDQLLTDRPVATSGEPSDLTGAPSFVAGDDTVLEPEALLYQDDLSVEIGRVPALIATLQQLVAIGPAVCKLTVDVGGGVQYGTAFRVGPDLLLTNWHVLHRRADGMPAVTVTAEFRYEDDGRGGGLTSTAIACDAGSIVADRDDDWAVVRVAAPLHPDWPVLPLVGAADPVAGDPAFVIQHPLGGRKRVAIVRNQVSYVDERVVHYLSDTQVGSSGSPVLDHLGRIIALHHAGGRPQDVLGKPPVLKNEGIRIPRVLAGLRARAVPLAADDRG